MFAVLRTRHRAGVYRRERSVSSTQQAGTAPATDWASGSWTVTEGNETAFVARWGEFLQWTKADATGFRSAYLIHDRDNPGHFISFAQWESVEHAQAWRMLPGFATHFRACRELCEDLYAADYVLEVLV
ncbi:MAG: antibiotic biosynthesis monooxygenase [Nocardioides sp.]|nr:antibiotic biosynthesis monooxygenase [Nocardioides sp.]